ncbi:MAG: hypothetical protein ACHQ4F_15080 [Candidatus Dormibacteria bacterium]
MAARADDRSDHVDRAAIRHAEAVFGFWVAMLTAALAAAALAMAVTTPPRSGPYCSMSCIAYPYTNAAAFVPRDYLWMYPAALLSMTFIVLVTCIHRHATDDLKSCSLVAMCFASLGAALIISDYLIQVAVVQPSLLDGQVSGLSLFSQYNPHGIFIALEDGGYSLMGLAFLFSGLSLRRLTRLERFAGRLLVISGVAVIGVLVTMALIFGKELEYRFEVIALSIDWIVLVVAGVLLGVVFKRLTRASRPAPQVAVEGNGLLDSG